MACYVNMRMGYLNSNLRAEPTLELWEWRQEDQWGLLPPAYLQVQWEILAQVNHVESGISRPPDAPPGLCMSVHGCAHIHTHHTNTPPHAQPITHVPHTQTPLAISHPLTHACTRANRTTKATHSLLPQPSPKAPCRWYSQPESHKTLLYPHSCPSLHPRTLLWHKPGSFPVFLPKPELLSSGKSFVKPSVRFWRLKGSLHTGGCHFEIKAYLTLMRLYSLKGRQCSGSFQNQATLFLRVGLLSGT